MQLRATHPPSLDTADALIASKDSMLESMVAPAIRNSAEKLTSITWEHLTTETCDDADLVILQNAIQEGFLELYRTNPSTSSYWQYLNGLHMTDGVVIYDDRVVVLTSLRPAVLDALHEEL